MKHQLFALTTSALILLALSSCGRHDTLWYGADKGNIELVREKIASGTPVDELSPGGRTPLSLAAYSGNEEILKLLVDSGADVNAVIRDTPPLMALINGMGRGSGNRAEMARYLIENGANVNFVNSQGVSILSKLVSPDFRNIQHNTAKGRVRNKDLPEYVKLVSLFENFGAPTSISWEDRDLATIFEEIFVGTWNTSQNSCNNNSGFEVVISKKDVVITDYEFWSETPYCRINDIGRGNRKILIHAQLSCSAEENDPSISRARFFSDGSNTVNMDLFDNGYEIYHRCAGR